MKEKQDKNYSIKDLKIEELIPNNIDGVIVSINEDGRRQTNLPFTMTGERYNKWKQDRGGVFHKDVFLWIQKKEHGKYIFMESGNEKLIVRLINDNELENFESRKLIQGKIKDKPYMIFKNLSEIEYVKEENGYIDEILSEELFETDSMKQTTSNMPPRKTEVHSSKNISLFKI